MVILSLTEIGLGLTMAGMCVYHLFLLRRLRRCLLALNHLAVQAVLSSHWPSIVLASQLFKCCTLEIREDGMRVTSVFKGE